MGLETRLLATALNPNQGNRYFQGDTQYCSAMLCRLAR